MHVTPRRVKNTVKALLRALRRVHYMEITPDHVSCLYDDTPKTLLRALHDAAYKMNTVNQRTRSPEVLERRYR